MLYLASESPRRRKLLKAAGVKFRVLRSDYTERHDSKQRPSALVKSHAIGKAAGAVQKVKNGTLLAADTLVFFKGHLIGKPSDLRHAKITLSALQGNWHTVYTGVAFLQIKEGKVVKRRIFYEKTGVLLKRMSGKDIDRYFLRVNPLDKAGAYAIQARGTGLVCAVKGSFSNAVGLPMERLRFL